MIGLFKQLQAIIPEQAFDVDANTIQSFVRLPLVSQRRFSHNQAKVIGYVD
jgi:hypothetical protein